MLTQRDGLYGWAFQPPQVRGFSSDTRGCGKNRILSTPSKGGISHIHHIRFARLCYFNPLTSEGTVSRSMQENTRPPIFNPHIVGTYPLPTLRRGCAGAFNPLTSEGNMYCRTPGRCHRPTFNPLIRGDIVSIRTPCHKQQTFQSPHARGVFPAGNRSDCLSTFNPARAGRCGCEAFADCGLNLSTPSHTR